MVRDAHQQCASRGQIPNRIEDALVESIRLSPLQPPVEFLAHIGASLPKLDVILTVGHRILMEGSQNFVFT